MKTSAFALILLASATAFTGVARADESETAVNMESQRVAAAGTRQDFRVPQLESAPATTRPIVRQRPASTDFDMMAMIRDVISDAERAFFAKGDRGLGNN